MSIIISCSEKNDIISLDVSPTQIDFSKESGSQLIQVKCNDDWNISEIPNWISLSAVSGVGNKEITVTAKENTTGVLRQGHLLFRTGDSNSVLTINISQSSGETPYDYQLSVLDNQEIVLNGAATSTDSIFVNSNVQWVLEGPEWLLAAWDGLNVKLDGKMECSGSGKLILMGAENNLADNRSGVLILRSIKGDCKVEIPITQLGLYNVRPVNFVVLANSFAFSWKYGAAVQYIFWQPFENEASAIDKTVDAALKYVGFFKASSSTVSVSSNKKANTNYEICALGANKSYGCDKVCSVTITTPTDNNQPIAYINNTRFDDQGWHWTGTMNAYASGFYVHYDKNATWENKADAYIAMMIKRYKSISPENYQLRTQNGSWIYQSTDDIQIITWAVDINENFSNVISRDILRKSVQKQVRALEKSPYTEENCQMPSDKDLVENSFWYDNIF